MERYDDARLFHVSMFSLFDAAQRALLTSLYTAIILHYWSPIRHVHSSLCVCSSHPNIQGKPKVLDEKETSVYKRALDREYSLKLKASRAIFSEINKKFPTMPFASREIGKDKPTSQARLGIVECLNHELLHPYPVLREKAGDLVAHFKATVLLVPSGVDKITGIPVQEGLEAEPSKPLDADIVELLKTDLKPPRKKKNKKKKKGDGGAAADEGDEKMQEG